MGLRNVYAMKPLILLGPFGPAIFHFHTLIGLLICDPKGFPAMPI